MREVLEPSRSGREAARLALDVYIHSLRAEIAAMAASLGGLDVLVFTGGVGERSPEVRTLTVAGLGFLGAHLDEARNQSVTTDAEIGAEQAAVKTLVVAAREDLEIARQVRVALGSEQGIAGSE